MKRAIVYLAWGEKHIGEAMTSARTAALVGVDRLLITDRASVALLPPDAPFERVIEHVFVLKGFLTKPEMLDLLPAEYNSFLYLDSDTRVLLDVDQGFEKAERYGIAAAPAVAYALEHFWDFDAVLDRMQVRSREILQYNAGVIFFTRESRAWAVLKRWEALCRSAGDYPHDQPFLTLAMEMMDLNPYTLSIAYNYRNFGEIAHGRIRIWHSRTAPPVDVNDFEPNSWPPRRFRNSQRFEDCGE